MTRIVAGVAGGRRLSVPAGRGTRPTADPAREGLFATLLAIRGPLGGARVLDLYAGSGAVGLEALSRGASDVLLVESDARAARAIRGHIGAVRLRGAPGGRVTGWSVSSPAGPAITRRAMWFSRTRPMRRRTATCSGCSPRCETAA